MVPKLWLLYFCGFLFGFGSSAYVSASTVWTMDMWGRNSRPFLQTNDFSFAVGSILCTIILKPYLVGDLSINSPSTNQTSLFNLNNTFQDQVTDPNDIDRRSRLMWPVLIIGFCILPGIHASLLF